MTEITKKEFLEEIAALDGTDTTFNIESLDGGSIHFSMDDCKIGVDKDFNEISIFKPYTAMEADICLDIVDTISKEDGEYILEFNNCIADVAIKPLQKAE